MTPYPTRQPSSTKGRSYLAADMDEEKKDELPPVPAREKLDTHAFDVGAEHASGWSLKDTKPKPVAPSDESSLTGVDALIIRDAGEVNRVQYERIKELKMPLSDSAAQHLPVTIRSGNAPDFMARDPNDTVQLTTVTTSTSATNGPVLDEAQKMGLIHTHTEEMYSREARKIRYVDRYTARKMRGELARNTRTIDTAVDFNPGAPVPRSKTRYNPLMTPGQTFTAFNFKPTAKHGTVPTYDEMPGSVSSTFVPRLDSLAGNDLEQIVVVNPGATQNALDRSVFSPEFRNLQEYPPVMRPGLKPSRLRR